MRGIRRGLQADGQDEKVIKESLEAELLVEELLERKPGGNHNPEGSNQFKSGVKEVKRDNVTLDQNTEMVRGNARPYALRKLKADSPELYAKIKEGKFHHMR